MDGGDVLKMKRMYILLLTIFIFLSCYRQRNYNEEDYLLEHIIEWSVEKFGTMPEHINLKGLPEYVIFEWYSDLFMRMIVKKINNKWEIISFIKIEKNLDPNYKLELIIEYLEEVQREQQRKIFKPKIIKDQESRND